MKQKDDGWFTVVNTVFLPTSFTSFLLQSTNRHFAKLNHLFPIILLFCFYHINWDYLDFIVQASSE